MTTTPTPAPVDRAVVRIADARGMFADAATPDRHHYVLSVMVDGVKDPAYSGTISVANRGDIQRTEDWPYIETFTWRGQEISQKLPGRRASDYYALLDDIADAVVAFSGGRPLTVGAVA